MRVANILKQASAHASEAATEDQASDHSHQNKHVQREPFELEVTEETPTEDQLRSVLEYVGAGKLSQLVQGASSESDAMSKIKSSADSFQRPVVSHQLIYSGSLGFDKLFLDCGLEPRQSR